MRKHVVFSIESDYRKLPKNASCCYSCHSVDSGRLQHPEPLSRLLWPVWPLRSVSSIWKGLDTRAHVSDHIPDMSVSTVAWASIEVAQGKEIMLK